MQKLVGNQECYHGQRHGYRRYQANAALQKYWNLPICKVPNSRDAGQHKTTSNEPKAESTSATEIDLKTDNRKHQLQKPTNDSSMAKCYTTANRSQRQYNKST